MSSGSRPKVNLRSTAVKRIMQEASELADADDDFTAAPLESDIFEWHCTMRGVPSSEYEGGLYHLRILLPPSYPMSAPDIILLTPNGRFELGKKICIDGLTSFHAGSWQPAWGVRTAVLGLRSFWMQGGEALSAIGALDYSKEERRRLAKLSREWRCPACASTNIELLPDAPPKSGPATQADADSEGPGSSTTPVDPPVEGGHTETGDPAATGSSTTGTAAPDPAKPGHADTAPDVPEALGPAGYCMVSDWAAFGSAPPSVPQPPDSGDEGAAGSGGTDRAPMGHSSMGQQQPHHPTGSLRPGPTELDSPGGISPRSAGAQVAIGPGVPVPIPSTITIAPASLANTVALTEPTVPPPRPSRPPPQTAQRPLLHRTSHGRGRPGAPMWLDALIFACFSMLLVLFVRKAVMGGGRDAGAEWDLGREL